jgi:hypothetical protein
LPHRLIIVAGILLIAGVLSFLRFYRTKQRIHLVLGNGAVFLAGILLAAATYPEMTVVFVIMAVAVSVLLMIAAGLHKGRRDGAALSQNGALAHLASPVIGGLWCILLGLVFMPRLGIFNGISLVVVVFGSAMLVGSRLAPHATTAGSSPK